MNAPPRSKDELEREKLELEIDILKLEKEDLEAKESPLGNKWQIVGTLLGFLGWVIAAGSLVFSVYQFNEKQDAALKQQKQAQTESALAKIQEDPLRLVIYLEDYTEQATPLLVEMIHVRHEEINWPDTVLRALRTLKEVDADLTVDQAKILREEARRGWRKLNRWTGRLKDERDEKLMTSMDEVVSRIYGLVGVEKDNLDDTAWEKYLQDGGLKSVPDFGT